MTQGVVEGDAGAPGVSCLWSHLSQGGLEPSLLLAAQALGTDTCSTSQQLQIWFPRPLLGGVGVKFNELTSFISLLPAPLWINAALALLLLEGGSL